MSTVREPLYRDEELGRAFEDFSPGQTFRHRPGRTITEADNVWFTLLTMNTHPLHFDNAYAAEQEFGGKALVNSCLTLSMVVGMSVRDTSQRAIANLGWTDIKLTSPVFVGDTIYAESEVIAVRESAKRPGAGIVTIRTIGTKSTNEQFISFERNMLMHKRSPSTK